MFGQLTKRHSILLMFFFALASACFPTVAFGQNGGGGGGGDDDGGGGAGNLGGIEINAEGVISAKAMVNNPQLLNRQRAAAAMATLNKDLTQPTELRKVSLTRLEREIQKKIDAGEPITSDMQFLAGMTRISHVFFYPETRDIVIAGPAEGYFVNAENRVVGLNTGQATLCLQDLIVALRAFGPDGNKTSMISVSIDPTQEGIVRMRNAYAQVNVPGRFHPGNSAAVTQLFRDALGLQKITISGVSTKTNFARVLVEADYHMKLIGIGLERPPVKIISFIEKASPTAVAKNSLQRWYFQPNYDCVSLNEDHTAMRLDGSGVKLVGEDERVSAKGERQGLGRMNGASKAFCGSFTRMYDELAKKAPLWGELRNLMDLSIVAAFIQKYDLYRKADWKLATFGNENLVPVEIGNTPTDVAPVANPVWKGSYFMVPIAGGVSIQPRVALNSDRVQPDKDGQIDVVRDNAVEKLEGLAEGQWWWD